MNLREVTIGRSKDCDIYLDQRCQYASNLHGTIYYDGNQLMYKDHSTNGTMVNNISVCKRAVPIHRGDIIMIAGKYPVNWNQIDSFFPYQLEKSPIGTIIDVGASTPKQAVVSEHPNLSKWSWGAFSLSWIWGVFNGCWWMLLVKIGTSLLTFLATFIPFAPLFVSVADLCISIFFGIKGTEWAWNNRSWSSLADFRHTQDIWNKIGLILFIVGMIGGMVFIIFSIFTIVNYM